MTPLYIHPFHANPHLTYYPTPLYSQPFPFYFNVAPIHWLPQTPTYTHTLLQPTPFCTTPLSIHPFHPLYSYHFHKTHYTPFIEPPPYTTPSDFISFEKYNNSKNIQVDFDHNYTNRTF